MLIQVSSKKFQKPNKQNLNEKQLVQILSSVIANVDHFKDMTKSEEFLQIT